MKIIQLTSDFHTKTVISRRVCLLVKMASKTVIRPIKALYRAGYKTIPRILKYCKMNWKATSQSEFVFR